MPCPQSPEPVNMLGQAKWNQVANGINITNQLATRQGDPNAVTKTLQTVVERYDCGEPKIYSTLRRTQPVVAGFEDGERGP